MKILSYANLSCIHVHKINATSPLGGFRIEKLIFWTFKKHLFEKRWFWNLPQCYVVCSIPPPPRWYPDFFKKLLHLNLMKQIAFKYNWAFGLFFFLIIILNKMTDCQMYCIGNNKSVPVSACFIYWEKKLNSNVKGLKLYKIKKNWFFCCRDISDIDLKKKHGLRKSLLKF